MSFVNIVNTNTFFFIPMKKLSQSYAHMDSHDAIWILEMLLQGRVTIFWPHIFGGGRIFGLLT